MIDNEMCRSMRITGLQSRYLAKTHINWVRDKFHNDEWDEYIYEIYCRRKHHHRLVITNESVRVARKMLAELDVLVFPVAERLTTPYKDAGSWGWMMINLLHDYWGSSWSLRECGRKDRYLVQGQFNDIIPDEVGAERIPCTS